MGLQYKTIRVSDSVLSDLNSLQHERESIPDTINRLADYYKDECEYGDTPFFGLIESKHYLWVHCYKREIPENGSINNILRIPISIYNKLKEFQEHPDEIFNTTIFKIITMQLAEKQLSIDFPDGKISYMMSDERILK